MTTAKLKRFFPYYGGKWRLTPRYPAPICDTICEPFAGSAGYSVRYYDRHVYLNDDADPIVAGLWSYLVRVKPAEILALPLDVPDLRLSSLPQEARWLIGFWYNAAMTAPCNLPSAWMREGQWPGSFWSERTRQRIASQLEYIRHWKISNKSYEQIDAPQAATWFVDPPYSNPVGKRYRHNKIDYKALAQWCERRKGQLIVCENEGADWLPFEPFHTAKGTAGKGRTGISREVIYAGS